MQGVDICNDSAVLPSRSPLGHRYGILEMFFCMRCVTIHAVVALYLEQFFPFFLQNLSGYLGFSNVITFVC